MRRWIPLAVLLALTGCKNDEATTAPPPASTASSSKKVLTNTPPKATTAAATIGTLPTWVGLAERTKVPPVTALTSDAKPVTLASLGQEGPLLLVFYRGGW